MGKDKIIVSGVQGDVISDVKIIGNSNIVGKNILVINSQQLARMPDEYANSLQAFSETVNQQLKKHKVPPERVAPVQESINQLAKEIEDVKKVEEIGYAKKTDIKAKLAAVAEALMKILPKTAETIVAFTPLAPFSKLIGEGVEEMVKAIQKGV